MARYDYMGFDIERTPVAEKDEEGVDTGGTCWEFTVTRDGWVIPIVVTSCNRHKGLRKTQQAIRRFLAEEAQDVTISSEIVLDPAAG